MAIAGEAQRSQPAQKTTEHLSVVDEVSTSAISPLSVLHPVLSSVLEPYLRKQVAETPERRIVIRLKRGGEAVARAGPRQSSARDVRRIS